MSQPMRSEAIKRFLLSNTHNDLASLYSLDLECQVNVARDGAEKTTGTYQGREYVSWSDGQETWKSFRIPYNAASDAMYTDKPMSFSLDKHAEGIGMTGWDWKNKVSRWFAYDFDSIVGHAEGHTKKLTQAELDTLRETVTNIPWVTLRKSTGGNGLHLYVFVTPVETQNHTEHAALARSVLHMLSAITGYEFASKVDVCGANIWVWHRKLSKSNGQGLTLIKQGTVLDKIPPNWREHTHVITQRSKRVNLQQISDSPTGNAEDDMFNQLTTQRSKVPLDADHRKLLNWLMDSGSYWWWDNNMWMLVTHTSHLKEAHTVLKLRGVFETVATGEDKGHDHNCFAYPLRNGGWTVRRYTEGTLEAKTWQQDGKRWTRCFYNREINLETACTTVGGLVNPSGGYYFSKITALVDALTSLRLAPELPDFIKGDRHCEIKTGKSDGKIIARIEVDINDPKHPQKEWILEKKKHWARVFTISSNQTGDEIEKNENYDDVLRHLTSEANEDRGWVYKGTDNVWREEPLAHVKLALTAQGYAAKDINNIIGVQVVQPWKLVNRPFEPEYPGNREWNRGAAQLAFMPSRYSDVLAFPTWQILLEHAGKGIDEAIKNHEWCQKANVLNGADYLKLWIASLIKCPTKPLPYLFFWSEEQNTGKSSFHQALSLLFTKGCMNANSALTENFNGEIESAVVCYIEEKDLSKQKSTVYNRIKDWVTAPKILIHPKHITPYLRTNCTHWIQCSNDYRSCPVFPGDTRITMIHVPVLPTDSIIVPEDLEHRLKTEASDFLAYIMRMEIPASNDRLNIPFVNTADKIFAQDGNKTILTTFLEEETYPCDGNVVLFSEFYEKFKAYVVERGEQITDWSNIRVGKEIPMQFAKGRLTNNVNVHVSNLSFDKDKQPVGPPYARNDKGFLVPRGKL